MSKQINRFVYLVSILSAVGGFLFGYDTGIVSGAMIIIRQQFRLNDTWRELIVSITIASAWLFSSVAGYFTDKYGRKLVIIVASAIFTIGAVMMPLSNNNKWILLIGRGVIGIGIGLSSMVVPMYIAEVAPNDIRGSLVTLNNCFITGGQFIAAICAGLFTYFDDDIAWRLMLGCAAIPAFIQFVGFFFVPESPRWLIRNGMDEKGREVLRSIRGPLHIEEEFQSIEKDCLNSIDQEYQENLKDKSVMQRVFSNKGVRKALIVGCVLQMAQQLSGINTVMYYSATIIQMSGIYNNKEVIWMAAGVASVNFVFTFVGFYLVETMGRRKLTLCSLAGVIVSLILLAIGFKIAESDSAMTTFNSTYSVDLECVGYTSCVPCVHSKSCGFCYQENTMNASCLLSSSIFYNEKSNSSYCSNGTVAEDKLVWAYDWCPSSHSWLIVIALSLYLLFFAPGMGPMPWTINAEIYPLWARSSCYSVTTSICWASNLIISLTFISLTRILNKYGTFFLYTAFALAGFFYLWFNLPETKGISLDNTENVENLFLKHTNESRASLSGRKNSETID